MLNERRTITDEDLAALADVGAPVTILRRVVGLPVRGKTAKRIDQALEARGLRAGSTPSQPPPRAGAAA